VVKIIGKTFNKLTVLKQVENAKSGHSRYLCVCECGNTAVVYKCNLIRDHTKSCGCDRVRTAKQLFTTHGQTGTRLHRIWVEMKHRCYLQSDTNYHKYGARGITVCDEWRNDFKAFYDWAMSHGYSDELTIDRIDGTGNYEPTNCRWATYTEQNLNRTFRR